MKSKVRHFYFKHPKFKGFLRIQYAKKKISKETALNTLTYTSLKQALSLLKYERMDCRGI
jgi:hypothetical protein